MAVAFVRNEAIGMVVETNADSGKQYYRKLFLLFIFSCLYLRKLFIIIICMMYINDII